MVRVSCRRLAALAAALITLAGPAARATTLAPVDLGELVSGATWIVHGRVVAATAQWLDGRRGIETIVTLAVEDALKGTPTESVSFRVPGGLLGRYRSVIPGAPAFAEGDEVIVFLGGTAPSIPHLVGFSQGVYRVRTADGQRLVRPGVPAPARETTRMARGLARGSAPLAVFEAEVRTLVAGGGLP